MAKRVKFPLEMRDGVQVRNIDELREYFDIEKALGYLVDGKLSIWLEDRYYISEAEIIKGIDPYAADAKDILCSALGVELEVGSMIDMEEIERRKERLAKLKQYTDDEMLWEKVDKVAFNQDELDDLLNQNCNEIYLCDNKFGIPYVKGNITYIGISEVSVKISAEEEVDLDDKNIILKNINVLNDNIYNEGNAKRKIRDVINQFFVYLEDDDFNDDELKKIIIRANALFDRYFKKQNSFSVENIFWIVNIYLMGRCLEDLIESEDIEELNFNNLVTDEYIESLEEWLRSNWEYGELLTQLEILTDDIYEERMPIEYRGVKADEKLLEIIQKITKKTELALLEEKYEDILVAFLFYYEPSFLETIHNIFYTLGSKYLIEPEMEKEFYTSILDFLSCFIRILEIAQKKYLFCVALERENINVVSRREYDILYLKGLLEVKCAMIGVDNVSVEKGNKCRAEAIRGYIQEYGNNDGILHGNDGTTIIIGYNESQHKLHPSSNCRYYRGSIMSVYKTSKGRIYFTDNEFSLSSQMTLGFGLHWIEPGDNKIYGEEGLCYKHWRNDSNSTASNRFIFNVTEYSTYDEILMGQEMQDLYDGGCGYYSSHNSNDWNYISKPKTEIIYH